MLKPDTWSNSPKCTELDVARGRLANLIYVADGTNKNGGKLSVPALRELSAACNEVIRLEGGATQ